MEKLTKQQIADRARSLRDLSYRGMRRLKLVDQLGSRDLRLMRRGLLHKIKSLGRASGQDLLGEMCDYYGLKRAKDADLEQLANWKTFCSKP